MRDSRRLVSRSHPWGQVWTQALSLDAARRHRLRDTRNAPRSSSLSRLCTRPALKCASPDLTPRLRLAIMLARLLNLVVATNLPVGRVPPDASAHHVQIA